MHHQEVEPTIGESLCRLFAPDENIDLRRIALIARQSLKRRDLGSTGKTSSASASVSRSTSDPSLPPPPGMTESSSSRSDKLLLGLCDSWPLCRGLTRTYVSSARLAGYGWRTVFTDIIGWLYNHKSAESRLGAVFGNGLITVRDIDSKIPTDPWSCSWTCLLDSSGKLWSCMNCRWGGLVGRTFSNFLWDVSHIYNGLIFGLWTCCWNSLCRLFHGLSSHHGHCTRLNCPLVFVFFLVIITVFINIINVKAVLSYDNFKQSQNRTIYLGLHYKLHNILALLINFFWTTTTLNL